MYIFCVATFICIVVKLLSFRVVVFYKEMQLPQSTLDKSFLFNVAIVAYMISSGLIWINSAVLIAMLIKPYI